MIGLLRHYAPRNDGDLDCWGAHAPRNDGDWIAASTGRTDLNAPFETATSWAHRRRTGAGNHRCAPIFFQNFIPLIQSLNIFTPTNLPFLHKKQEIYGKCTIRDLY